MLGSGTGSSAEGWGTNENKRTLAQSGAQEIRQRYSPAQTSIALDCAPGAFGPALEQELRNQGFAVGTSGTAISYTADVYEDGAPPMGYVLLRLPEGQYISFSRELDAPLWPTVNPAPVSETPMVAEAPLPDVSSGVIMPASLPAVASPTAPVTPLASAPVQVTEVKEEKKDVPPYTVSSTARAAQIATRNNLTVADFCQWNDVAPTEVLPKGYKVYLAKPTGYVAPVVASAPAAPKVASVPPASPAVKATAPFTPVAASIPAPTAPEETPLINPISDNSPHAGEPLPLNESWPLIAGGLRNQVQGWADRAGYQLVWQADNDFDMAVSASFEGDFLHVLESLFSGSLAHSYDRSAAS